MLRGIHTGAVCSEGLHPMEGTYTGAVHGARGRTHIGEVSGGLSPIGRAPCWSGRNVRSAPLRGKEQQRQHVMDWLQTPISHPPVPLGGEVKLSSRRGERSAGVLRFRFFSHYPTPI